MSSVEIKDVHIWKPISFSKSWERCSTSRLDALLPSWLRKRETLKEDANEYVAFMNRLKRQHAIETGIVEKLYDLSEGITETFIKEGFVESYLQHGDTNIPSGQLMAYLQDNFEALDFVFDVVKNNRPITKGFIKELHQLITRHQDTAEGRDQFGNRKPIPLLKGAFKERENNPTRADGTRFIYCPPVHVDAEMDRLISIYSELEAREIHPVTLSAWLHHAFVAIHPFQDGNGRVARLLASLVLIKHNLFPMTVKRNEKKRYIDALELADEDQPQELVDFFSEIQNRNIEAVLNLKIEVELSSSSMAEMAELVFQRLEADKLKVEFERERQNVLFEKRLIIFQNCEKALQDIKLELESKANGNATFQIQLINQSSKPKLFINYRKEIAKYAKQFGYYYNHKLPGAVYLFDIQLAGKKDYRLIIPLHHFGYDDSTLAIGAILTSSDSKVRKPTAHIILPLCLEPYTISLESDYSILENSFDNLKSYLQNVLTLALAQIVSEMG